MNSVWKDRPQGGTHIGLRLPVALNDKLERLAKRTGRTKSQVVRYLIEMALLADQPDILLNPNHLEEDQDDAQDDSVV